MSICAVLVTYHPTEEIISNVGALIDQVDEIVIVDNGSGSETKQLFTKLQGYSKIHIIYNNENLGIAAALNMGVKTAKTAGHQWVITFDQDSQATPRMIERMLEAYEAYPQHDKVVGLAPRYKDKNIGDVFGSSFILSPCEASPYAEVLVVMTSGNMLKLSAFDTVGYFNEALFIDQIDNEFCLRCADNGHKILEVKDAILFHSVGTQTQYKLLWMRPVASHHNALRRYYIARNFIYIFKKYFFKHSVWFKQFTIKTIKNLVIVIIFENDRRKKIVASLLGLVDGLLGRMGKCRHSLLSR